MKTRILFSLIFLTFLSNQAKAVNYLWLGTTSASWTDPKNWYNQNTNTYNNGYPNLNSDVANIGTNALGVILSLIGLSSNYQPAVPTSTSITVGTINFGNVVAPTLTLNTGATLTPTTINNASGATTIITGAGVIAGSSTINIGAGTTSTLTTSSVISASALNMAAAGTLTANANVTLSGAISINGSSTITGTATVKGASLPFAGSYTLTVGANLLNITGAATVSTATITFVNNASGGAPTLTISGGTSSFSSLSFTATNPGTANISGTMTINGGGTLSVGSGVTMNLTSGSLAEPGYGGTFTNAGIITATTFPFNLTSAINFTNSGTITTYSSISMEANGTSFNNTGTITINPSASNVLSTLNIYDYTFTFNNTYVSAAQPGIINLNGPSGNTTTLFTISANGGPLNNSGTINATNAPILWSGNAFSAVNNNAGGAIKLVNSPFTISNPTTLNNAGSISASSASVINLGTSAGSTFNLNNKTTGSIVLTSNSNLNYPSNSVTWDNQGILSATSSNITITGNPHTFKNSTSTGIITLDNCVFTFYLGSITNTSPALFTAKNGSFITLGTGSSTGTSITNSGIFNAGISGSSCTIAPASSAAQIAITNTGTFNLGSTSSITLSTTSTSNPSTVTNTSPGVFTLESDAKGSASIGISGIPNSNNPNTNQFAGIYNVQRYITGGTGNRGYRLLSFPVNISSNTLGDLGGTAYVSFANINSATSTTTITNANAVAGTTNVLGALTGGPSGTTNGFSVSNTNPTLYLYDETKATNNTTFTGGKTIGINYVGGATDSYQVKTLTGTTTSALTNIPIGTGFMLYFIGDTSDPTTAATRTIQNTVLTAKGYINQQNITFKLWNTTASNLSFGGPEGPATAAAKKGFNLVGNPYPSTIDLHQLWADNSTSTGWVNFAVVKSLGANQTFAYYNANTTVKSDPTLFTQYIPSGGGFFIQATALSQSVTFKEDIKVSTLIGTSTTPPLLMSTPKSDILASTATTAFKTTALPFSEKTLQDEYQVLHLKLEKDSTLNDWCAIAFNKAWDDKYDNNDAYDMDGLAPKVFMSSYTTDGVRTGINSLNVIGTGKKIKLFVKSTTDGLYSLQMPDVSNIDLTQYKINLIDNYKRDSLDIGKYQTYNFNITNADTTTFGGERFVLSIQQLPGAKYQLTKFVAQKAADGVLLNWTTKNEGSNYIFTLEKQQTNGTDYAPLYTAQGDGSGTYKYTDKTPVNGSNTYRLKQVDLLGNISYSALVSVDYDQNGNAGMFSVYPNPTAETLNVNVTYGKNTTAEASYKLNIYDASGSLIMQKTSENTSWSENVSQFKPGIYIVELKGNNGNSLGQAKFVKR